MQRTHFLFIPEASLILRRGSGADEEVLLLRRFQTGYEDGKYCYPAGHKEPFETAAQAAIREAQEEAGIVVRPEQLRFSHVMHRHTQGHERAAFFFAAECWEGEPSNVEPSKCDHMAWFKLTELPEMIPYMRTALDHVRAGRMYSEYGWNANEADPVKPVAALVA